MRRRTRDEWVQLVEDYARSGLTAAEFASRRGIARSTLAWWSWRLRKEQREAPALVPVRVVASTAPLARRPEEGSAGVVEVELQRGELIRIVDPHGVEIAAALIERLRRC